MRHDIIIAGVGGQGILTIARVLSMAALDKGINVKQAEVHGMSQRGGAVYSHLRISDSEIFSDLIPQGQADMVLSIEPLEALRYVQMLREGGTVIASTNAEVNIPDYPAIESVLDHVAQFRNHVGIDMEKIARAAGGVLAANIVALGAASLYLSFTAAELESAIEALFTRKGDRVVQTNIRAFRFGRTAAAVYLEALERGAAPSSVRGWISTLSPELLASGDEFDFAGLDLPAESGLSCAEAHAFESLLMGAYDEGRKQLYEHEVYRLIELVGAISPPRHTFVPRGSTMGEEVLAGYPGERVVLKLVSAEVVHKTEAGAVVVVRKDLDSVRSEIERLIKTHSSAAGVLVVEFVEHGAGGLGSELFVGIRATREFGPVIAAGLGGLHTEYLASKMRPGVAVAKAVAMDTSAEDFLETFKETAAYDLLSGKARGQERLVSDGELLRCFRAFISIARKFCVDRGEEGPDIGELEVNPFAFVHQRLVPLDGRGRLKPASKGAPERPSDRVQNLLEPRSIALIGVSSKPDSFGRIILSNILRSGFDPKQLTIVKKDEVEIEGVKCVSTISDLSGPVDLLVMTAPADALAGIIDEANDSGKVRSGIMISGGAGETSGSQSIGEEIEAAIRKGRYSPSGGAVFLGPNCMGVQSRPGKYDTFFVPESKLPSRRNAAAQPLAILSQSGAFIVSRLSALNHLSAAFTISIGNQADVTMSDLIHAINRRDDVQVLGIYLEGFADLDGLETVRALAKWTQQGKGAIVYKAGRTEVGRSAAAGHTAAVAGDYDICQTALRQAGAIVVESFSEFSQLVETATLLCDKEVGGGRFFAVTNAGMEAVAMADSLRPDMPAVKLEPMSELFEAEVATILENHKLDKLVGLRNPIDLTPMAGERPYGEIVKAALLADEVDAVIVSCIPLAPVLHTLDTELADLSSFAHLAKEWRHASKPVVFVVDAGGNYDALADAVREAGIPVFRSADEAMPRLSQWIHNRMSNPKGCSRRALDGANRMTTSTAR
jgi:indolepyruvate ferredoxin oxidoreductase beta subunit